MTRVYQRCDGVGARRVDDETFLIAEEIGTIHHLNATGAAVWRLLRKPMTRGEIVATLGAAFPETESRVIDEAVGNLLGRLEEEGLVMAAMEDGSGATQRF